MNKLMNNIINSYLALDYGEKFVGMATFLSHRDPYPLKKGRLDRTSEYFWQDLMRICYDDEVTDLVIGIPFYTDGTSSKMTEKVKYFVEQLTQKLLDDLPQQPIKIHLHDETLTTYEAEQRMLSSPEYNFSIDLKQIDALSALVILEDFLKQRNMEK